MKAYQATAHRSGDWWALSVEELPGVQSQVRSLRQAETALREAIGLVLDVAADEVVVIVTPDLPKAVHLKVIESRIKVTALQHIQEETAALSRDAARALIDEGLSQRDAAEILGVSFQRVSQLVR